jgi:alkanesulfonate monooxygenase SsuD/methylene tetrahydromethanopterin reductase-like flavin-dependent oxidoreductase (luciferase family)
MESSGASMFVIRFDLRVPDCSSLSRSDQYREALAMTRFADEHGFAAAVVSEHHATDDGFMHSPLPVAAAFLGATQTIGCMISALLLTFYEPLKLAEDIASLELMFPGRLTVVAGLGYRPEEFDMFGMDRTKRARDFEARVTALLEGWKGDWFEYDGQRARISPAPITRPNLMIGGSVPASARRAARFQLPYMPPINDTELVDIYLAEAAKVGYEQPVPVLSTGPGLVLITDDPDALWARIGPNLVADADAYASWQTGEDRSSWHVDQHGVDALRASAAYAIVTPDQCVELIRKHGAATLHPLVAGIDPEIGWESLQLAVDKVLPQLPVVTP